MGEYKQTKLVGEQDLTDKSMDESEDLYPKEKHVNNNDEHGI